MAGFGPTGYGFLTSGKELPRSLPCFLLFPVICLLPFFPAPCEKSHGGFVSPGVWLHVSGVFPNVLFWACTSLYLGVTPLSLWLAVSCPFALPRSVPHTNMPQCICPFCVVVYLGYFQFFASMNKVLEPPRPFSLPTKWKQLGCALLFTPQEWTWRDGEVHACVALSFIFSERPEHWTVVIEMY